MTIGTYRHKKIEPLARDFVVARNVEAVSVADIGCFKRPMLRWIEKLAGKVDYIGVDEDPEAVSYLTENGISSCGWTEYLGHHPKDYTFGLEVIEHIKSAETHDFLSEIRNRTKAAFFMTTPNFEGWDARGADAVSRTADLSELRYVPDHLGAFDISSANPHAHKQAVTAASLNAHFAKAFPRPEWNWSILKAWPWRMNDLASNTSFLHHFKLHAVAWRVDAFTEDMEPVVHACCANSWVHME